MKNIKYLFWAISLISCSKITMEKEVLLKDFSLIVNGLNYHANIDESTRSASIGVIEYGGYVSGVSVDMAKGAKIVPEPASFIGNWPESQDFTISKGEESERWNVKLTSYISDLPKIDGKKIIFQDEFEKEGSINQEFWSIVGPGTAAWQKDMSGKPEHSYVKDGNLILVIKRDDDGKVRSGGIMSEYKVSIKHNCHIEARIKFVNDSENSGQAFWLMPDYRYQIYKGWPEGGEIDILEHNYLHDYIQQTLHSHYIDVVDKNNKYAGKAVYHNYNPEQYNIYGADILENSITLYTNGEKTMTYENLHLDNEAEMMQWPFTSNFYIILSTSPVGAKNIVSPSYMYVDWIRVTEF